MSLDSDRSQDHCPEEDGVKSKSKVTKKPQMESEPEDKHREGVPDAKAIEVLVKNNEENMATEDLQPEDGKSSDVQGRTSQNNIQNRASKSNAQAQPPQALDFISCEDL